MSDRNSISRFLNRIGRIKMDQWTWGFYGGTVASVGAMAFQASRPKLFLSATVGFLICLVGAIGISALKAKRQKRKARSPGFRPLSEADFVEKPSDPDQNNHRD